MVWNMRTTFVAFYDTTPTPNVTRGHMRAASEGCEDFHSTAASSAIHTLCTAHNERAVKIYHQDLLASTAAYLPETTYDVIWLACPSGLAPPAQKQNRRTPTQRAFQSQPRGWVFRHEGEFSITLNISNKNMGHQNQQSRDSHKNVDYIHQRQQKNKPTSTAVSTHSSEVGNVDADSEVPLFPNRHHGHRHPVLLPVPPVEAAAVE